MKKEKIYVFALICVLLICLPCSQAWTDGGYFSSRSVAVSADQRAIIIKNGSEISMTFSTGYTGEGGDFAWIIPTPVPPSVEDISEAGEEGETAFEILDGFTAPEISISSGGCFPSGTDVLTTGGTRAIETVEPGIKVYSYDLATGEWIFKRVLKRLSHQYEGDMIGIQIGDITIQATGNHPFYVVRGDRLASRPLPQDVPREEQVMTEHGRWVEARDLEEGDLLKAQSSEGLTITGLSSRHEKAEVYNLTVEGCHNYAVHRKGILVHNKMGKEQKSSSVLVTVYGRILLEHYEVSILGADDASHIMNWLQENGYNVNPSSRDVLDTYIDQNWAFVAVKFNPGEKRHYENEFLPPLTIKYRHGRLIFPLHISSVSTTRNVRITLYVIAESTVTSSNFQTTTLKYEDHLTEWVIPEIYIEACILGTMAGESRGLVVMWGGELVRSTDLQEILDDLMKVPFPEGEKRYLTRLETRMDPEAMTEDIRFMLDTQPNEFSVKIHDWRSGVDVSIQDNLGVTALMYAVLREQKSEMISSLLKAGADVNAKDILGVTAFMYAARYNQNPEVITSLLKAGADLEARNRGGWPALMYAAANQNPKVLSVLLEAGANVKVSNERGWTALMYAAANQNPKVLSVLLEAGADVNVRNEDGETALMRAARYNQNPEVISMLLEAGADVKAKTYQHWTALMRAARYNENPEVISVLLEADANVNVRNRNGWTAFMYAAWHDQNPEVISVLLEAGADVNARQTDGLTALIRAAENENPEVISMLLEAGADVNAQDKDNETALMRAAGNPNSEVISMLLEAGADVNERDKDGETALIRAAGYNQPEVISMLLEAGLDVNATDEDGETALMRAASYNPNPEVITMLLEAGADVNERDKDGETALMHAAGNPNSEVISVLLEAGADVNTQNKDGWTALMRAAMYNQNPEVISVLVEAGADVNARNRAGCTALMYAAKNQNPGVISVLLEAGSDVNATDEDGETALMWAAWNKGNPEVMLVLLEAGADVNVGQTDGLTALMRAARYNPNPEVITMLLEAGADAKIKDKEGKTAFDYAQDNAKLKGTDAYEKLLEAQY